MCCAALVPSLVPLRSVANPLVMIHRRQLLMSTGCCAKSLCPVHLQLPWNYHQTQEKDCALSLLGICPARLVEMTTLQI
ncbi:hypothetical protein SUGI_0647130 [Cryptomeria japonica]|nr:hypothetical protein SUGI_0647130 [Cryptomeria japonica]